MNKIEAKNLTIRYKEGNRPFTALEDVSFDVEAGRFVSVVGPSGCGKSTLLGALGGLRSPTGGSIHIDGVPVTGPGSDRSMVFQHYSLFPWMTARDNVAFGIKQVQKSLSRKERLKRAGHFLAKVGLADFEDKYPARLSGGMRQRVAIARALAMNTRILLMDEPFGAVDARNRIILQDLLLSLWEGGAEDDTLYPYFAEGDAPREERKTVVFVTHDIDEALLMSDSIIMLGGSPGRIFRRMDIPFDRPRNRALLMRSAEYAEMRNELFNLFFDDYGGSI